MQLTKYKLGDLIAQRREKNKDYDLPIRGVSRDGFIKPKVEEADTSIYNVFYKNDFVFNPARMELNSIALNLELDKALCSSLYEVFYVKDENVVLPEFLNLHIKRDEFARHCDYLGLGSAREYCRFANIAEFDIKIPSIEVQLEIVQADRQIKRRIRLNEQMIEKLEATAQALYRKTFVDNIDKENLPEGWRMGTLGEFGEVITGKTPSTLDESNFGNYMPFVTIPDMHGGFYVIETERGLSQRGVAIQANKTIPKNSVCVSCIGTSGLVVITSKECQTNQQINSIVPQKEYALEYIYLTCCGLEKIIAEYGMGAAVLNNLNKSEFENLRVIVPLDVEMRYFHKQVSPVFKTIYLRQQENKKLTELQSLLLAKMGQ
jgi:type I restriction enzyme S subunit